MKPTRAPYVKPSGRPCAQLIAKREQSKRREEVLASFLDKAFRRKPAAA